MAQESQMQISENNPLFGPLKGAYIEDTKLLRPKDAKLSSIPIIDSKLSFIGPSLAIFVQIAIPIFLIIIVFKGMWLEHDANTGYTPLSNGVHAIYVTAIALLATLVSSFTVRHIRRLWLQIILNEMEAESATRLQRRQSTVLISLGGFRDNAKSWHIWVSLLISGLVTTAIVAGLSLSEAKCKSLIFQFMRNYSHTFLIDTQGYTSYLALDYYGNFGGYEGGDCLLMTNASSNTTFAWKLDETYLSLNTSNGAFCGPAAVSSILQSKTVWLEEISAYAIGGVTVDPTAVGVPFDLHTGLTNIFGAGLSSELQDQLQWSENCLPVLNSNPVQCMAAGNVSIGQNEVTVSAGDCTVTTPIYSVDPQTQGASASGVCTQGQDIGKATIVIGSVNDHAVLLAQFMMDDDSFSSSQDQYSVLCSVDIRPTIGLRKVIYQQLDATADASNSGTASGFYIIGDPSLGCNPVAIPWPSGSNSSSLPLSAFLTNTALATGASASWNWLNEGRYQDGWLAGLFNSRTWAGGSYDGQVFNNSKNPLEDTLGAASAVALGSFWGGSVGYQFRVVSGISQFNGLRIGPGIPWAVVYALPSLFTAGLLIYLIRKLS